MTSAPLRPTRAALLGLRRADPVLAEALRRHGPYPGFPDPARARRETHFAALARSIVFQQLAGAAASTIHRRVCALTPGPGFPAPAAFVRLSDETLRGAGLSRPKLLALRDLAERTLDRRLVLASAGRLPDDEIVARLVEVRGIGRWTAQMFLMFRLGRLDVMPSGDLGVQEGLRRLDRLRARPAPDALEARAERWAPLRSVAAWTLWRVADDPDAAAAAPPLPRAKPAPR